MSVALVEQRRRIELERTRPAVVVPVAALEESRLPVGEVVSAAPRIHVRAGRAHAVVAAPDCVMLERGAIVSSLLELATRHGARVAEAARVLGADDDGLATTAGRIRARTIVDASGAAGARLLGELAPAPRDVASVAHETRALRDPPAAEAFLASGGVARGEPLARLAPCGPGTMVIVRVDEGSVDLFAVTLGPEDGAPTARAAIRRFVREHTWVGEAMTSSARHVALGPARASVVQGGIALVGGAAGASRPTRGAEVAQGIVAARMLVDALERPGELARYDAAYRRRFARAAATDRVLREALRTLGDRDLERLVARGVLGERLVRALCEARVSRTASVRLAAASALSRALAPVQALPRLALAGARG